jgi:hypothetical protein
MNDDEIKNLLQSDHSVPDRPHDEWSQILLKIDQKKTSFNFFPPIAASMFVVTLFIIGFSVKPNFKQMYDEELSEYLFSESYFQDDGLSFYSESEIL